MIGSLCRRTPTRGMGASTCTRVTQQTSDRGSGRWSRQASPLPSPDGYAGLVTPRSGLAARHGISVVNGPGLVDAGYRGEIKVVLVNLSDEVFVIARGDRIAQLVVVPVAVQEFVVVDELPATSRGSGGFGSTGA